MRYYPKSPDISEKNKLNYEKWNVQLPKNHHLTFVIHNYQWYNNVINSHFKKTLSAQFIFSIHYIQDYFLPAMYTKQKNWHAVFPVLMEV